MKVSGFPHSLSSFLFVLIPYNISNAIFENGNDILDTLKAGKVEIVGN